MLGEILFGYFILGLIIFKLPPRKPQSKIAPMLIYLLFTPISLIFSWIVSLTNKNIYFCLSVDGDLTNQDIDDKLIKLSINILNKSKLKKKASWFINNEFGWTTKHKKRLAYLSKNYDIHLHSHHLLNKGVNIKKAYAKEKQDLEKFILKYNKNYKCLGFRSGEHITPKNHFSVLNKLGFKIDSSIMPGKYLKNKYNFRNQSLSKSHYFKNGILELPTFNKIPGLLLFNTVISKNKKVFLSFFFHPFELVKGKKLNKFKYWQLYFLIILNKLHFPKAKWITVSQAYNLTKLT